MTQTITVKLPADESESNKIKKSEVQVRLIEGEIKITGIPQNHRLEYLAKSAESKFYVVHTPKEDWDYDSFRLHIGGLNELVEAKVEKVIRYRDGGTTNMDYTLNKITGTLNFPTKIFNNNKKPTDTYNDQTIELDRLV